MKNCIKFFCVIMLTLTALTACNTMSEETVSKIKVGVSTKKDVQALLGKPQKVSFDGNRYEIWDYIGESTSTSLIKAGGVLPVPGLSTALGVSNAVGDGQAMVTVQFDKKGIVRNVGRGQM